MAVTLSAVVLLAIVVFLLVRKGSLRILPALAAIAFGFFLASTHVAKPINSFAGGLADVLASISF